MPQLVVPMTKEDERHMREVGGEAGCWEVPHHILQSSRVKPSVGLGRRRVGVWATAFRLAVPSVTMPYVHGMRVAD